MGSASLNTCTAACRRHVVLPTSRSLPKTIDYPTLGSAEPSCMGERKGSQRAWNSASVPRSTWKRRSPVGVSELSRTAWAVGATGHAISRRILSERQARAGLSFRGSADRQRF